GHARFPPHLHPGAVATRLSRHFLRLPRHRRRELCDRHRPLAAFLDDAWRDVGHVRRHADLEGARERAAYVFRGFVGSFSLGVSSRPLRASVASSTPLLPSLAKRSSRRNSSSEYRLQTFCIDCCIGTKSRPILAADSGTTAMNTLRRSLSSRSRRT